MVSLWPFGRRDDNSPDSFERILAKLAAQITRNTTHLATLRQRSRRYKALFTLYSVFGYILYDVLVVLLHGYENLGLGEIAGIVSGPVAIYGIRRLLDLYYGRRISGTEVLLEELQARQRETVEKLKAATKYSTTQSIIEKYGGGASTAVSVPKPESEKPQTPVRPNLRPRHPQQQQQSQPGPQQSQPGQQRSLTPQQQAVQAKLMQQQRAGIPPQFGGSPHPASLPSSPSPQSQALVPAPQMQPPSQQHIQPEEVHAARWYDRLMDVLIGEDETSAKARYALICTNCRMVNGLAPPGTRSLDEMEPWGCARCGKMNGNQNWREARQAAEGLLVKQEPRRRRKLEIEAKPESESEVEVKNEPSDDDTTIADEPEEKREVKDEEEDDEDEEEEEEEEPEPEPKPKPKAKGKARRKG